GVGENPPPVGAHQRDKGRRLVLRPLSNAARETRLVCVDGPTRSQGRASSKAAWSPAGRRAAGELEHVGASSAGMLQEGFSPVFMRPLGRVNTPGGLLFVAALR